MRVLALVFALALPVWAAAVPQQLSHQARLLDAAGLPLDGTFTVRVALYAEAVGGTPVWEEAGPQLVTNGYVFIPLGNDPSNPLSAQLIGDRPLYVALAVDDGVELSPRLPIVSVPFAIRAGEATSVAGGVVDASEIRVNGEVVIGADGVVAAPVSFDTLLDVPAALADGDDDTLAALGCLADEVVAFDGAAWGCVAAGDHTHDASALVSGVVDVNRLPVGNSDGTVASGSHGHDAGDVLTGVFAAERIPSLDASKISSGELEVARIPSLDASKIGSGAFDAARIPSLDASKIGSGAFDAARIPSLDATKIATGTLAVARLPVGTGANEVAAGNHTHSAAAITSGTFDPARIPGTTAGDLTVNGALTANSVVVANPGNTCGSGQAGTIRFASGAFEGCDGARWVRLGGGEDGASASSPARTCASLHAAYPSLGSGVYWLDPDAAGPRVAFQTYCDMTTDGGGWTLVWKHSYMESATSSANVTDAMRFYSSAHTACLGVHRDASSWCNVPTKRGIGTTEQRIMASHNGTVVYDYKGPVHALLDVDWQGGYLSSSPTRIQDRCTSGNTIAPESVNPSTGFAVAGVTFDKANPGVFTGNCDTDRYAAGSGQDCRWENCSLPGAISSSVNHVQQTLHLFVR